MRTALLALPTPAPSLEALLADMTDRTHDLIAQNAQLERDLKSVRSRCRTMTRALNDRVSVSQPVATARGTAMVSRLLLAAQTTEALGEVPVIRFARDDAGRIVGIELALLEQEDAGSNPLTVSPVQFGGMACVGDHD